MTRVSPTDPSLRAQRKLYNPATGAWETAVEGVEYEHWEQMGGAYGIIYVQFFPNTLTGTNPRLDTSPSIVDNIFDWALYTHLSNDYYVYRGRFRGWTTGEANITLDVGVGENNLTLTIADTLDNGWVAYTKV